MCLYGKALLEAGGFLGGPGQEFCRPDAGMSGPALAAATVSLYPAYPLLEEVPSQWGFLCWCGLFPIGGWAGASAAAAAATVSTIAVAITFFGVDHTDLLDLIGD